MGLMGNRQSSNKVTFGVKGQVGKSGKVTADLSRQAGLYLPLFNSSFTVVSITLSLELSSQISVDLVAYSFP